MLRCSKLGRWLGGLWGFEPPAPGTATSTIARSCGYSNPTREPRETTRRDAGNSLEPPRRKVGAAAQRAARYLSAGGLTRKLLVLRPRAPRRPLVAASGSTPGRNCARTVVPATLPRATYYRSRRPVLEGARRPRGGLPQHSRCFLDRYAQRLLGYARRRDGGDVSCALRSIPRRCDASGRAQQPRTAGSGRPSVRWGRQ